jgi:capsular polysaccharide biosynthesis protein
MNEDRKISEESQKIEYYQDEIELIDILRVIWIWKYLIISGTVLCGIIAAIISLNMNNIYTINMVLRPGILGVGEEGRNLYIDTPHNIIALIDTGTFNKDILNYLNEIKMKNIPKQLGLKVTMPQNSDTIKVEYKTEDIKQGMIILSHLSKLLSEKYSHMVKYFKKQYDVKLDILKNKKEYIKAAIKFSKRNMKNIEKQIDELSSEVVLIKNNTTNLIRERDELLSKDSKETDILSSLLYSNTIQQNLQLSKRYQDEINNHKQKIENELQQIEKSENDIIINLNEIKKLQFKKDNIQNIQFLQQAYTNPNPIKPRTLLIFILALLAGLLLSIFLAFLLEYINKHKKE